MAGGRFFKRNGAVSNEFLSEYEVKNAVVALTLIQKILDTKKPPNKKTVESLKNVIGNCGCLMNTIGDFATKVSIILNEDKEKIQEAKNIAVVLKSIISTERMLDQKILAEIISPKKYVSSKKND
ncbi:MAG: hypothetical protein ABI597_11945 [Gammaproteobacteria bacterium]